MIYAPTGNCEFDLDGGEMSNEITSRERQLTGKLRVNTIEERQQGGEEIQIIEGTFDAGNDPVNVEYQSQINGTLVSYGNDLIFEAHGIAGSPYEFCHFTRLR